MKKFVFLGLIIVMFIGCSQTTQPQPHQDSIQKQRDLANEAWQELEHTTEKKNFKSTINTSPQQITQTKEAPTNIASSIPSWFYNPPKDDKFLYGVGEGSTPSKAKNHALNNIASQIQTTISSEFTQSQGYIQNTQNTYSFANLKIKAQTNKIDFTNIQTLSTIKFAGQFYTLIKINKNQFIKTTIKQTNNLYAQIKNTLIQAKNFPVLQKIKILTQLSNQISQIKTNITILNALSTDTNTQKYSQLIQQYSAQKQKLFNQLSFQITPKNSFYNALIQVLTNKGCKISPSGQIKIKLKQQINYTKPYGMYVAKDHITNIFMANKAILSSFEIDCKGIANDKQTALLSASNNFKQKLQAIKLNNLLGF